MPCTSSCEIGGHAHDLYKGHHLEGHFFFLIWVHHPSPLRSNHGECASHGGRGELSSTILAFPLSHGCTRGNPMSVHPQTVRHSSPRVLTRGRDSDPVGGAHGCSPVEDSYMQMHWRPHGCSPVEVDHMYVSCPYICEVTRWPCIMCVTYSIVVDAIMIFCRSTVRYVKYVVNYELEVSWFILIYGDDDIR